MGRFTLLISVFVIWILPVKASHILGGEVSYRALDSLGNYRFTVVVFRACDGISFQQGSVTLQGPVSVSCPLVASYDITPNLGNCAQNYACSPPVTFNGAVGSIGKFIYEGTVNLSSLTAAPIGGYTWYTSDIPCCRNANQNAQGCSGMTLRVTMHAFTTTSGIRLTPRQMRDSSPRFLEDPAAVVINNPFDTAYFNNFAQDPDREDIVRFDFNFPWQGNIQLCNYTNGFTSTFPMPGLVPWGGPPVDSMNGQMSFRPTSNGAYLLVVRVRSFHFGQLISEVFRDFQLNIINNPVNSPPTYNPLVAKSLMDSQQRAPIISIPSLNVVSSLSNSTFYLIAGDTLSMAYTVKDSFPVLPQPNRVRSFVRSDMLGSSGTNPSTGCAEPPCAIIQSTGNQPITLVSSQHRWNGFGIVANSGGQDINGRILWTTAPQHARANGRNIPREYRFGLFAFDDVCPLAGTSAEFFEVVVLPNLISLLAPKGLCVEPLSASAHLIRWNPIIDSMTIDPAELLVTGLGHAQQLERSIQRRRNSFIRAELIRTNALGGRVIVANITSPDVTAFTDATAAADSVYSYQLRVISALDTQILQISDAVVAPRPGVVGDRATLLYTLNWQPPYVATSQTAGFNGTYYIYQRNVSMQSAWQLVDSVVNQTSYSGPIQLSNDTLAFRIGWMATNSCSLNFSHTTTAVFDQSLSTPELDVRVRIYPNPVGDVLRIDGIESKGYKQWRIFNVAGKLVLEGDMVSEQIATQKLIPGHYFLELLKIDNSTSRFKFQKK